MSRKKYASADAAVKAMENFLLSKSDMEQLINAGSVYETESILSSKNKDVSTLADSWKMLREYAPDSRELEILLYKNDFHNLKAVLKALISNHDPKLYYIEPSNVSLEALSEAFRKKDAEGLPEYMRDTAKEAYLLVTKTLDGQLSDSLIDTAALKAMQESAEKTKGGFMKKYAELMTVCADIKTAYRCCKMKKSRQFLETAVCGSGALEKEALIKAALGGMEELFGFLEINSFGEQVGLLKESPAQFEKYCDDLLIELAESSRMKFLGYEPLAAYYIAKEAEIKNLRIIRVCKESGTDRETITERMRKLYV